MTCWLLLASALSLSAQTNPSILEFDMFVNDTLYFSINSAPNQPSVTSTQNGTVDLLTGSDGVFNLRFIPNEDFRGEAYFTIQYYYPSNQFPFFFSEAVSNGVVRVADAIVNASDDFVDVGTSSAVTVYPIVNDTSTATGLRLDEIAMIQQGAVSQLDSATFVYDVPQDLVELDQVVYTTTDDKGTHGHATVYVAREATNYEPNATLEYTIGNTETQVIKLPVKGFAASTGANADLGELTNELDGMLWTYKATTLDDGLDSLVFDNGNGVTRTVIMRINDYVELSLLEDDVFYTPIDESVTIDVFENDNFSGNVVLDSHSPEMVHVSGGVFTITPPLGFQGILTYDYTIDNGFGLHQAKVEIYVGNLAPQSDIDFAYHTPSGQQLILNYDIPMEGYYFTIDQGPSNGFALTFANSGSTFNCGDVTGKAYIVYTPTAGYVGLDSMTVSYCTNGGQCDQYQLSIDVYNTQESDCKCLADCVNAGDTNGDGRINVRDVLPIARAMGFGGPAREDIPFGKVEPQAAQDWDLSLDNGRNFKHIDADGSGSITIQDVDVVANNYNELNNLVPRDLLAFKDYPFYLIPQTTEVDSGDLLVIDVAIGNSSLPVEDFAGLVFGMNINPGFVDSASLQMIYDEDSWFAANGSTVQMYQVPRDGELETVFAKANGNNANGYGIVGQLSFIVEDETEGIRDGGQTQTRLLEIVADDIVFEAADGRQYALPAVSTNVTLNLNRSRKSVSNEDLILMPNPTQDMLTVHLNGGNQYQSYAIYDLMGNLIDKENGLIGNHQLVNVATLSQGVYILQVESENGIAAQKFVKI